MGRRGERKKEENKMEEGEAWLISEYSSITTVSDMDEFLRQIFFQISKASRLSH